MPEALALVKRELGPDAIILGTRSESAGLGILRRKRVEITAAPADTPSRAPRLRSAGAAAALYARAADQNLPQLPRATPAADPAAALHAPAAPPAPPRPATTAATTAHQPLVSKPVARAAEPAAHIAEQASFVAGPGARVDEPSALVTEPAALEADPLFVALVQSDMSAQLAQGLLTAARADLPPDRAGDPDALAEALRQRLAQLVNTTGGLQLTPGTLRTVALVGPSGAGKTTTIVKLAAHYALQAGVRVALAALDTQPEARLAALRHFADLLGVPLHPVRDAAAARALRARLADTELLLIDTYGVGLREPARFARLASLLRGLRPDEVHLVLPVTAAPAAQERAAASFAPLGVSRLVLTRLDEAVGAGVVIEAAWRLRYSLSLLCHGQDPKENLEIPCGGRLAAAIMPPGNSHLARFEQAGSQCGGAVPTRMEA